MIRNTARPVDRAQDIDTVPDDGLAGHREFAIATPFGSQIENNRARGHGLYHLPGHQNGRLFSRDHRRRDDYIAFCHHPSQQFALTSVEGFVLRCSVTTGILCILGLDRKFQKPSPQAVHLLFGRWAHVIGGSYGSQPTRGGDCLQPRHSGSDDEHACRRDAASCCGQHGKKPRQGIGSRQNRLITTNCAHRRERIHALCSRDAGNQLHRKRSHARVGNLFEHFQRAERSEEADYHLPRAEQWEIFLASHVVRTVTKNLNNNIGPSEYSGSIGFDLRALFHIRFIRVSRLFPSSAFEQHLKPCLHQAGNHRGNQGYAAFAGVRFLRNTNNHNSSFPCRATKTDNPKLFHIFPVRYRLLKSGGIPRVATVLCFDGGQTLSRKDRKVDIGKFLLSSVASGFYTGTAVLRAGLKNGVFTTVTPTFRRIPSMVSSICNWFPRRAWPVSMLASAIIFLSSGDQVVEVALPTCLPPS